MKKALSIILTLCVVVLIITCKKKQEVEIYNLTIGDESIITTTTTATITASFSYPTEIYDIKVILSTNSDMSDASSWPTTISGNTITANLDNLTMNTKYYYCYRYNNNVNIIDTDVNSFTTLNASKPTVTTGEITNITKTTASAHGNVTSEGGVEVTVRGVCWSTSHNPTVDGNHEDNGTGTGEYTIELSELTANTTYYVKAYAINSMGTSYGEEVSFTTLENTTVPTVTILEITNVTQTSALASCNVTSDGGDDVIERGVCWSTNNNPTIDDNHANHGIGTGAYAVEISGLTANTMYYVRAYAKNGVGIAYGNLISFTTSQNISTPTVTTTEVSNITTSSAIVGGNVTSDGGAEVTERGVCWSTFQNPSTNGAHMAYGSGTGTFTVTINGLSKNTKYYVRAYAKNTQGTSYGNQIEFTTLADLPTVTTSPVSNITQTTAICGGNVTNAGGATIIERGVCWSTAHNPTVSGNHATSGTGTGIYTVNITGLTANTIYYVCAYAKNSAGTAYGPEVTFTTLQNVTLPTVTTNNVTNITGNSATCGGNVTSNGGANVTARGVCWSTSTNPTISNSHTTDGTGTGAFVSNITGLSANTTYYVRAYATNSAGTNYGAQKTLTTTENGNWLYYGSEEYTWQGGLWWSNNGTLTWGIKFTPSELSQYYGYNITKVRARFGEVGTYTMNIYRGGSSYPSECILTQTISVTGISHWRTITFSSLPLTTNQNLWITFSIPDNTGGQGAWWPPANSTDCAANNPNARLGVNSSGQWVDMYVYGDDWSWLIQAYLTNSKGDVAELDMQ